MRTASESSPEREPATITNSSLNDPSQSQSRQRSVGPQGRSVEQSVEDGPRRSARLGAHLPQGPSTSAPPRRSARLNSTRRWSLSQRRCDTVGIGISIREHSHDLDLGVSLEIIQMKSWTFKIAEHQNHATFSSLQVLDANTPPKPVGSFA